MGTASRGPERGKGGFQDGNTHFNIRGNPTGGGRFREGV